MNCLFNHLNQAIVVAPTDMTELVRGNDQRLIQRVSPLLREQSVSLDLRSIDRIDAAGIAALISLYGSARNWGHEFTICNVSNRVAEILSLVGLESILMSHDAVRTLHSAVCFERPAA
jgi:anti-anti-sigma factor